MNDVSNISAVVFKWFDALRFPDEYKTTVENALKKFRISSQMPQSRINRLLQRLFECEALEKRYAEMGIDEKILTDTLSDLLIWTNNCMVSTGELGLDEWDWFDNHFSCRLFRLGRLQFCLSVANRDAGDIKCGDSLVEIHIPQGEALCIEECKASIKSAVAFFEKFFPSYKFDNFICYSWLLDYELQSLLGENSNILKFQKLFNVVAYDVSTDAMRYVFELNPVRGHMNHLQKSIWRHMETGGVLHEGYGIIPKEEYQGEIKNEI